MMGDTVQGDAIANNLFKLSQRDGTICEIFAHRPDFPVFQTNLVITERPFSWGASFVMTMLFERVKAQHSHSCYITVKELGGRVARKRNQKELKELKDDKARHDMDNSLSSYMV
jgi:hypothetical protein